MEVDAVLADPYAVSGRYLKAQLHAHSTNSDGRLAPAEVADLYRARGYAFLVLTDHDRVTPVDGLSGGGLLVLPGIEETVPRPTRWAGPHLGVLLAGGTAGAGGAQARIDAAAARGGIVAINHPTWPSVLRIGAWPRTAAARLRGFHLVEVRNPHSDPDGDTAWWVAALSVGGPGARIGPIAVDDLHRREHCDRGWTMVKVAEQSEAALRRTLLAGACYASTGPACEFGVRDGEVAAAASERATITFLDAAERTLRSVAGRESAYRPRGDEGFVRVEVRDGAGRAWSNAFWVTRAGTGDPGLRTR